MSSAPDRKALNTCPAIAVTWIPTASMAAATAMPTPQAIFLPKNFFMPFTSLLD